MTLLPDKRFKDQLEHFKKSPPPQAWSRIESGLNDKKSYSYWLSIAATILILLCASFILWYASEIPKNNTVVPGQHNFTAETDNIPASVAIPETSQPTSSPGIKTERIHSTPVDKGTIPLKEKSLMQVPVADQKEEIREMPAEYFNAEVTPVTEMNSISDAESIITNEIPSSTQHSNKITYSSGEVNSRFLKKDSATSIPSAEKTPTGFQKILDIAAGLKEEAALGELRQMKDEILSFPIKEQTKEK